MSYAAQLCDFLTLSVCDISMLLNSDIFSSFGSRYFLKTCTVVKESSYIHQHCLLNCFHRLGKVTPNHGATLPTHIFIKIKNLEGCQDPDYLWFISTSIYRRWSRGHKAQIQGYKKLPRPRAALPKTDPLEAKDRNARDQGQGPRTQAQVFSKKKKGLQKNFSDVLQ